MEYCCKERMTSETAGVITSRTYSMKKTLKTHVKRCPQYLVPSLLSPKLKLRVPCTR
jgi:hypothetical protein